jgi:glutathione S-transferase
MSAGSYDVRGELARKYFEEGRENTLRRVLTRQLALRFGVLPSEAAERILMADSAQLERWIDRVLIADSVEGVFGMFLPPLEALMAQSGSIQVLARRYFQEGQERTLRDVLIRQLVMRFGTLSASARQRIAAADMPELDRWIERVPLARTLDAVFDPRS